MNRKQRRGAAKAQPSWKKLSVEQRQAQLIKNGISVKDLDKSYKDGYSEGFDRGVENAVKQCYAAFALAMHEMHGFGAKRCVDVLNCADKHLVNTLTTAEILEQTFQDIGFTINFKEPFERVEVQE